MLVIWIPLGITVICLIVLLTIAGRKISYLRALDVLSLPKAKVQELKKTLVAKRLSRLGGRWGQAAVAIFLPLARLGGLCVQALKSRVAKLEERYQRLKRESTGPSGMGPEALKKLIAEAEQMIKEERFGEAEKKLIEILSHDAKNFVIYEDLGALYMRTKNWDQAEETFKFVLKLRPNDASVLTSLGEIQLQRGNPEEAATYFGRAVKKRPNNPRYLDFLIEASIRGGELTEARRAVEKLRVANPENQKLGEFDERIKEAEERRAAAETVGKE